MGGKLDDIDLFFNMAVDTICFRKDIFKYHLKFYLISSAKVQFYESKFNKICLASKNHFKEIAILYS